MKIYRLIYLFLTILSLVACDSNNDLHDHPQLKIGKQFFDFHCATCHSKDGHGQFLKGIPSNRATELSIQQIIIHLRSSKKNDNRKMPIFPSMSSNEARKIATYLLELKEEHATKSK